METCKDFKVMMTFEINKDQEAEHNLFFRKVKKNTRGEMLFVFVNHHKHYEEYTMWMK